MRIKHVAPLFMVLWGVFFLFQVSHIIHLDAQIAKKTRERNGPERMKEGAGSRSSADSQRHAAGGNRLTSSGVSSGAARTTSTVSSNNSSATSDDVFVLLDTNIDEIDEQLLYSFSFNNGPDSEKKPKVSFRSINNSSSLQNDTMAACLYIMDDTIRLTEWVAYHYTVLPLRRLIVAVDPKSQRPDKIARVLDRWRNYIQLDVMYNDSWIELKEDEGWNRQVYFRNPRTDQLEKRPWLVEGKSDHFKSQEHKRRQNSFIAKCLHKLGTEHDHRWALIMDSDEYLVYNYIAAEYEDQNEEYSVTEWMTKEQLQRQRRYQLPLRNHLPKIRDQKTVAEYLHHYADKVEKVTGEPPRCYRFPHLVFLTPSEEQEKQLGQQQQQQQQRQQRPGETTDDPSSLLSTLMLTKAGARTSNFSKSLLDLSTAQSTSWFTYKQVINVHTPIRRMCGKRKLNGDTGSGADFISSLLRIHHYRAGTAAMQAERAKDYRGATYQQQQQEEEIEAVVEDNNDIVDWYPWFQSTMPQNEVERLLLRPLQDAYREYYESTKTGG